jgi:hypothetical protein
MLDALSCLGMSLHLSMRYGYKRIEVHRTGVLQKTKMDPHNNDGWKCNDSLPADWEATCFIYSDNETSWKKPEQSSYTDWSLLKTTLNSANKANSSHLCATTIRSRRNTLIVGYGSIDLAIAVQEVTFARYERS